MGSSTRGPGPLTRQCAAPPPAPSGGGLCGEGPCPARALPPPSVVGLQRRDRRVPWVGFPQRVLRPAPRAACAAGPRKRVRPDPPPTVSGVLLAAAGLAPGVESGQCRTRQTSVCGQSPEAAAPPPRGGVAAVAHSPGRPWGVTARAPAHGLVCVWCGQWASLLALDSGPRFWALGPCHMVISVALGWTQTACRCAWEGPRAWRGGPWRSPLAWSPSALPAPGPGRPGAGGPGGRGAANVVLLAGALARLGLSGGGVTPAMFLRSSGCSVAPEFIFGRKSPRRLAAACLGALPEKGADLRLKPRGRSVRDDAAGPGAPVRNAATRHRLPAALTRRAPRLARSVGLQPLSVSFALSVDNIHSGRFFLESHGVSLCVLCEVSFEN